MPRRKKELGVCGHGRNGREKPQQRNAANARERARMRILSRAFSRLKTTLPWVPADTKLSKLDTLRLATSYIAHLRTLVSDDHSATTNSQTQHPIAMTWPFSFNKTQAIRESPRETVMSCEPSNDYTNLQNQISCTHTDGSNYHYNHAHNYIDRYYSNEILDYEYNHSTDLFQMT